MGIDSFTLFAQLVNLCVLVWLLKHFLYQPVLKIITQRSQEIETLNQSSLLLQKETEAKSCKLEKQQKEFENSLKIQQEEIQKSIEAERKKALEKLKDEINQKRQHLIMELASEKDHFNADTLQFITKQMTQSIEKILTDFTKLTPTDQIIDLFIDKFNILKKSDIEKLNKAFNKQNVIYINSSNTLMKKQQEKIIFFIQKRLLLPKKVKIVFKTTPSLIQGIDLQIDSLSIQWSVKAYMDEFQENLNKHLKQFS